MTLRIQCPECSRNFRVSDELRGRTVECGACEHRFTVDEASIVTRREKFYPGEHRKPGLEGFSTAGSTGSGKSRPSAAVEFETAAYAQTPSSLDITPISPPQLVASAAGLIVLLLGIGLCLLGARDGGLLQDMEVRERTVLAFFIVIVGLILLFIGSHHRKKMALLAGGVLGAIMVALAVLLPVPRTVQEGEIVETPGGNGGTDAGPDVGAEKTITEIMQEVGYGPVKRAITTHTTATYDGRQKVAALWVPAMEERFKYQIQKYLHRKTGTKERPSFYRRGDGGLFVVEGVEVPLEEMALIVERFGRVENTYPDIRVIEIAVEGERLLEVNTELMSKLTDKEHPAFYVRNLAELDHIDIERVQEAASRLATAEPLRFRKEITQRLVDLLAEEAEADFKGVVTKALSVWSEEGDGAPLAVAQAAQDILLKGEQMPRSMLDFLTARNPAVAVPIIEVLWKADPSSWEPFVAELGPDAEEMVASHLGDENRAVQQSAARILKRIGSSQSLPALQRALPAADDELKLMIQDAIQSIQER
ncbi:MAG: hypothetical protein HKN82_06850 [Akkermansiaceae bacterium]|nr:hypothetical protein [Akkermansiaceae bacterium]